MSAASWNGKETTLLHSLNCQKRTDIGYKESLNQLLEVVGDLDRFENYSCSYFSPVCTLVPNALFSASKPDELLQFSFHEVIAKDSVDYSRLPEWNMVLLYALPMWVKSALILKTPRIVIQHEWAHALHFLASGSTIPLKTIVIAHEQAFSLIIRKDGQIAHASIQEYQEPEDILYHLANSFRQLQVQSKNEMVFYTQNQAISEKLEKLITQMTRLEAFRDSKITSNLQGHLQFQTLCV